LECCEREKEIEDSSTGIPESRETLSLVLETAGNADRMKEMKKM